MHLPIAFGGAVTVVVVLRYVLPVLAVAVIVDSARRPAWQFEKGGRAGRKWFWIAPQALFLVVQLLGTVVAALRAPLAWLILVLLVLVPFQQVAYLLMVVVPYARAVPPPTDAMPSDSPSDTRKE